MRAVNQNPNQQFRPPGLDMANSKRPNSPPGLEIANSRRPAHAGGPNRAEQAMPAASTLAEVLDSLRTLLEGWEQMNGEAPAPVAEDSATERSSASA